LLGVKIFFINKITKIYNSKIFNWKIICFLMERKSQWFLIILDVLDLNLGPYVFMRLKSLDKIRLKMYNNNSQPCQKCLIVILKIIMNLNCNKAHFNKIRLHKRFSQDKLMNFIKRLKIPWKPIFRSVLFR